MIRQVLISLFFILSACTTTKKEEKIDLVSPVVEEDFYIIEGENEPLDTLLAQKGKVLIAYSDCYQCHREENRAKGPSFSAIAKRYPLQKSYIELLSRKIISGGSGTWGYPVMSAHPKLSETEARSMVTYILSMDVK
ncbi:c-type cytochrome [Algoriphagus aquatilis]|uniref:C-type cytochrome n=1 Tax=Algoriphagus aquatilis TaxID=490186 RepID=A0ABW0BS72_9BACT